MAKWLMTGSALLVAGLLKIWQHTHAPKTLEDFLAFRCGSAAETHGESLLSFAGHCWGCPVAAVGAALIAYAAFTALLGAAQTPARRAVWTRRP